MSTEQNKKLVIRFWDEVWNQGNLALIDELYTPELCDARKFFIGRTLEAFSESHVTIEDMIAEGDKVVTRYSWRAVHTNVWDLSLASLSMRVPPTGREVWDRGIAIHRVAAGKIVEGWSEWTKLELVLQLEIIPTAL